MPNPHYTYGEKLLPNLARDLGSRGIPGANRQMLDRMRSFYRIYPHLGPHIRSSTMSVLPRPDSVLCIEICSSPMSKSPTPLAPDQILRLSWTHLIELLRLDDPWKRAFYENECLRGNWSVRDLQSCLLELGSGFCFEARQKRITVGNEHEYIDLVFYHRRLRCHLLIDLKVRAFKHGDAGQMNFYLNYWKANELEEGDSPPIGLLLCSGKDATKVEYATAGLDR